MKNGIIKLLLIVLTMFASSMLVVAEEEKQDTTVSFVNVYAGSEIYELEGHSAIRITFPEGADLAIHYGVFSFDAPNFLYRFVKGETDYSVGVVPWEYFVESYRRDGRRVVEHMINLDSTQKKRLVNLLSENLLPENRIYRYNYVKDNCATRPLRKIEIAASDSIILPPSILEADSSMPVTFRNVMRHYHTNYPWYQLGIDIALGYGIDYKLNRRETSFAPVLLESQLPEAKFASGKPVVSATNVIIDLEPDSVVAGPTPWFLTPMFVFTVFLLATILLTVRDLKRCRVNRLFDSIFWGVLGLVGLLLTFLIFVSVHEASSPNLLYIWLNPLCFIPTIFLWIKKGRNAVMCYQIANFVVLIGLSAIWWCLPQSTNPAFWLIIIAECIRSASYVYIMRKNALR